MDNMDENSLPNFIEFTRSLMTRRDLSPKQICSGTDTGVKESSADGVILICGLVTLCEGVSSSCIKALFVQSVFLQIE